jgi:hypothetical protein
MNDDTFQLIVEHPDRARCLVDAAGRIFFMRGNASVVVEPSEKFAQFISDLRAREQRSMQFYGLYEAPRPAEIPKFFAAFYAADNLLGAYCSQELSADLLQAILFQWPETPVIFHPCGTAVIRWDTSR